MIDASEHHAALVVGRAFYVDLTLSQLEEIERVAEEHAAVTNLPLGVFVNGTVYDEEKISGTLVAGLLLAYGIGDEGSERVAPDRFAKLRMADIPETFWSALAAQASSFDAMASGFAAGAFLVPLGWSVARFAMTPYDEEAASDPAREPPDHVLVAGVGDAPESMLLSHDLVERIATEGLTTYLDVWHA
jgi:hypothetical protein